MFLSLFLPLTLSIGFFCQLSFSETVIDSPKVCEANPYRHFNIWANDLTFQYTYLTSFSNTSKYFLGPTVGYYTLSYLRDVIAGTTIYWGTAGIWHVLIYNIYGDQLFYQKKRSFPDLLTITHQQILAQKSILFYAALPILAEVFIENHLTKVYFYIDEIGEWRNYFISTILYFIAVEISVYWIHRTLHTNKILYKWIHSQHHLYNKIEYLTPWAALAFHPIDGLLQASPYMMLLFVIPIHYFTFIGLLFFTSVWAINIHDSIHINSEPIMGSKYHTIHHTHYHYNFGQYFIFCDWLWGTLKMST